MISLYLYIHFKHEFLILPFTLTFLPLGSHINGIYLKGELFYFGIIGVLLLMGSMWGLLTF